MAIQAQAYQGSPLGLPVRGNSQEFFVGGLCGDGINGGNGCGLNFTSQQSLQKQLQQQMNQSAYFDGSRINGANRNGFSPWTSRPQSLHAQIDRQDQEIDRYLLLQVSIFRKTVLDDLCLESSFLGWNDSVS